jgi:hypothetical protein
MEHHNLVQIPANRLPMCWPDRVAYFERHSELLSLSSYNGFVAWEKLEAEYFSYFKCNRYESYETFKRCRAHFHNTRTAMRRAKKQGR